MCAARLSDDRDDDRPADPGEDVDVPDLDAGPAPAERDEPPVEEAPGDQEVS